MIFSDAFEVITMDILQACVFIGASLTVNGVQQGEITAADMVKADNYELVVSGNNMAQVSSYTCGIRSGRRFLSVSVTCDTVAIIEGETVEAIYVTASDPSNVCVPGF